MNHLRFPRIWQSMVKCRDIYILCTEAGQQATTIEVKERIAEYYRVDNNYHDWNSVKMV